MDPCLTLEASSLSHHSARSPGFNEPDFMASLSQDECLSGNIQSSGLEGSHFIGGSSLHPSHLSLLYGSEYRPNLDTIPKLPNDQLKLCASDPSFLLEGLLLTRDCVPVLSSQTGSNNPDALHASSSQYARHAGRRGANRRMEAENPEIEDHVPLSRLQDIYVVSGPSAPPELPSTRIEYPSSSPSTEYLYMQTGEQDDNADATSFLLGQVEGLLEIQGQIEGFETTPKKTKKQKDMEKKRRQRFDDRQHFARICRLLGIPLSPAKTRVHRILGRVEALVGQHKLDYDLRTQLGIGEAYIIAQRFQRSAESDTSSYPPAHVAPDSSDTPRPLPRPNGELDERHN